MVKEGAIEMKIRLAPLVLALLIAFSLRAQTPLIDFAPGETYLGFPGGLYPGGNTMPPAHAAAGALFSSQIRPRGTDGLADPAGKIVLLSIGMSNPTQEFCSVQGTVCDPWTFTGQALADPQVDTRHLVIANGAFAGTSSEWNTPTDPNYNRVRATVLLPRNLSEAQVQAVWLKLVNPEPTIPLPSLDADAHKLAGRLGNIIRSLKVRYPNLRLVYLSSRSYGGYAKIPLNPEPFAYETGYAVKWVIEAQIHQRATGVVDPEVGNLDPSVAPWIGWGPYLWTNGTTPRSDGLVWLPEDVEADGTHPSQSGEQKVGKLLLDFFKRAPTTRPWFMIPTPRRRAVRH